MLECRYNTLCSGCDLLDRSLDEQRDLKISHFRAVWNQTLTMATPEVSFVSIAEGGLRDRADLIIDQRGGEARLGLFSADHSQIVDLQTCPQMSRDLESWFRDFRKIPIPVQRGSVRLRVAPNGQRGIWLDLANIDVKALLEQRTTLDQLRAVAIVEIGQKRKRLVERDSQLKLADPVLEKWFETYAANTASSEPSKISNGTTIPLYCTVGSFTQPGFRANRALISEVQKQLKESTARHAIEFGSGIGNFTIPLATVCETVRVFEIDELALTGLRRSLADAGLSDKVQINSGNFQVSRKTPPDFSGAELIFVDPPRSGLMKFLDPLQALPENERAPHFLYVSCFAESFVVDSQRLVSMGYRPKAITLIDQFPQSRHYEIVSLFQRL